MLDREASILVGDKKIIPVDTMTITKADVEFLEVGTELNVRPFVASDGKVRLSASFRLRRDHPYHRYHRRGPDESTVDLTTNVSVSPARRLSSVACSPTTPPSTAARSPAWAMCPAGAAFQGQDDTIQQVEVIFLVKATVVENETREARRRRHGTC